MKPVKITIALAATLLLFFISCKKSHTNSITSPAIPSLIIGIYDTASNGTSYTRMVYNASYLLDSMIPTGTGLYAPVYMTTINYIDNYDYYIAASGSRYGKVKLNTNNVIDTFWEYNNNDELNYYCTGGPDTFLTLGISTSYPYNIDTNSIYLYNSDSDISAIVAGGQVQTFVYDLTHTYQQGDVYRQYEVSQWGAPYAVSKHLVTQWDLNGGWSMKYSYTFDSVGRINRIVILTDTTTGVRIDTSTTTYKYNN